LFYNSEGEEERETLDKTDPPYYEVEETSHEDETMMHALPFDEATRVLEAPTREEVNTINYFPFQESDDALFYDLESEEVLEEPLDVLSPSCYDKDNNFVDNIDEFIHVRKRKWDVIGYDGDPIYDIEGHSQKFPLQLSYEVTSNFNIWQQGDDMIKNLFQTPKDDLVLCSPNDFQSCLEDFDEYFIECLDLFHEENYQPPLCSNIDKSEDVACPDKDPCDNVFWLPSTILSRYVTKGVVGKHVLCIKFSLRQILLLEFKGRLNTSRRTLLSQSLSLPLRNCQSSSMFLLAPSQTSDFEDVQGSQPSNPLSQSVEPLIFHDPFLRWIEHFFESVAWHHFVPPTHVHELDFTIFDDAIHFLTHVIFMPNLPFFWFMMKKKGRCYETLLGWFH
jgi:hypothetical protein